MKNDLEDRTAVFRENVIRFCRKIRADHISRPLISQMIRSATSVGANYMEVKGASSKKDFKNKLYICKKESQETKHWLRMINTSNPEYLTELKLLWKEAHELTLIFSKALGTMNLNT